MDFEATLEHLARTIESAQTHLQQGQIVDLRSIENEIQDFCTQVQTLEPPRAHALKPQVAELISNLDQLEQNLKHFMNEQSGGGHG